MNPESQCCNAPMKPYSDRDGTSYYVCDKCNKACDPAPLLVAICHHCAMSHGGQFEREGSHLTQGTCQVCGCEGLVSSPADVGYPRVPGFTL